MPENLNDQQRAAVLAPQGPLLIVAGAGTGKTRTLTSRLTHFIEKGIEPRKICAITFTNKAAKEMAERISDPKNPNFIRMTRNKSSEHSDVFVDSDRGRPFIGTFHALGARILRKECRLLGRKPNFVIFDDHDSFDLIKKIVKNLLPPKKGGEGSGGKSLDPFNCVQGRPERHRTGDGARGKREEREKPAYFAGKISEIKNLNDAFQKLNSSEREADKLTLKIFRSYEKKLEENNAFDFDDLIERVVFLFKKHPNALKKYREKFDAILVDEYQDLNPKQYELIKLLAGGHRNLSVVGDDEQLIYGWRYANLKTFLDFERDWPGAQISFLEENYRSTSNIIGAASAVAANNAYRRPKNLWTKNEAGERIKIYEAMDEKEEAEWIAQEITKHDAHNTTSATAILYRTNAQSRAIEEALIRYQIPYQIFGGVKFYERKEIKDVVAALRIAANPADEISRDRLEKNLTKRKFSELWGKISPRQASLGTAPSAQLGTSRDKRGEPDSRKKSTAPAKLIDIFLKTTGYVEYLEKNYFNCDERLENISELVNFALRYDDLPRFLEEIALVQPTDNLANGRARKNGGKPSAAGRETHAVSLMTIHIAKGLEFDNVFIAGSAEGLLPHARSLDDKYQLEEERRLMYVAMTRAKKNLHIGFFDVPSRFISEIPEEFVEFENKIGDLLPPDDDSENFISYD